MAIPMAKTGSVLRGSYSLLALFIPSHVGKYFHKIVLVAAPVPAKGPNKTA
jgi:hypothetical protein